MQGQVQSRSQPLRMPLAMQLESRAASTAKDSRLVNAYVETLDEVQYVVKRPGTTSMVLTPTIANGAGQGVISFNSKLYAGIGSKLYEITAAGATVDKGSIAAGHLSFSRTSQVPYLFIHNSTAGWTFNGSSGTLASITDLDFPPNQTPALPLAHGAVYLDDMVFVMTTGGRIYNSAIEDPTSWGALDYISKISEPDGGVAIVKHLNFIVAFGAWSGEFFYNAGHATGSPLDRSSSYKMDVGCASGTSLIEFAQTAAWVGQSRETGRGVYILEGVSPVKISTPAIERYLNASTLATVEALATTIAGHTFYCLTLNDLNITLVCDINEKRWYQWSTDSAGTDLMWRYSGTTSLNGVSYLQNRTTGQLATLSTSVYQDETANINYRIVSYRIDAKSHARKFWQHLEIIGDKAAATLQIRHSDDDYTTWTTYRNVDLSLERPILRQLGSARRRVYDFFSTSNVAIRLQAAEILLKEGTF